MENMINVAGGNLDLNSPLLPQAIERLSTAGLQLREAQAVWLSGQPTVAIIQAALLEGIGTESSFMLPTIVVHGGGAESAVQKGVFGLNHWRHNIVRPQRENIEIEESGIARVVVLDGMGFSLTAEVRAKLAQQAGVQPEDIEVFSVKLPQADYDHPEAGILERLLSLPVYCWAQNTRLILLPEGWAPRAAIVAAACYGLRHNWPEVLFVRSLGPGKGVEFRELIDIQSLRDEGAALITEWQSDQTANALNNGTFILSHVGTPAYSEGNRAFFTLPTGEMFVITASSAEVISVDEWQKKYKKNS